MESLDLTNRLKVKHLSKSTLCLKYFRNVIIVKIKGNNKKINIWKIYLFLLPSLPFQDEVKPFTLSMNIVPELHPSSISLHPFLP